MNTMPYHAAPDFSAARKNMVDCQIHPMGVVNHDVLEAFGHVPREMFVAPAAASRAYSDEDVQTPCAGRFLLAPAVHAKMLQVADIRRGETVLDIYGGNGYGAAVMADAGLHVTMLEPDAALVHQAQAIWGRLGYGHLNAVQGDISARPAGPFDLIVLAGAVAEVPDDLVSALSPTGRMVFILKPPGATMGQAVIMRSGSSAVTARFDAAAPYMPGFAPKPAFVF